MNDRIERGIVIAALSPNDSIQKFVETMRDEYLNNEEILAVSKHLHSEWRQKAVAVGVCWIKE
jgi:propanediol dehydratase small subunit